MKVNRKILTCLFTLILMLCGCTSQNVESDAMKFKTEYESLNGTIREKDGKTIRTITIDEDNPIVYASDEEILNKIQNGDTFVVYFGFSDCPWCRSIVPTLIQVAKDAQINQVFYCDIKEIRDTYELDENNKPIQTKEGSSAYPELLKEMDNVLDDYTLSSEDGTEIETGEKRIFAPNIVVFVNGKAKVMTSGNSELQTDGYMELSEEILKDSYNMIKETFDVLYSSACEIETKC